MWWRPGAYPRLGYTGSGLGNPNPGVPLSSRFSVLPDELPFALPEIRCGSLEIGYDGKPAGHRHLRIRLAVPTLDHRAHTIWTL